jgi:hypothetical protein
MRRLWPIALVIFAACGTAATRNTPKPSVAAQSPAVISPPTASASSPTAVASLPPHCKLPLIESSASGGFLVFPEGTFTSDPLSHETFDETSKNLRMAADPAFHGPQDYSMDQPVFDVGSSRWLPVPRPAVSPDGSRYVYSQYLYPSNAPVSLPPAPTGTLIRVVTIATGDDHVIYRGVPYDVVGWKPEGVYLRRPCTDAYCKGGLWLLDPAGGSLQQVAAPLSQVSGVNRVPVWSALGGGAAWALAADPSNGNIDRLLRHDLNGGPETTWLSRPRSTWMSLLGISGGLPILAITENNSTGVWLITGRETARLVITMPIVQASGPSGDQLAPATPQGAPVQDIYGTWLGTSAGVFLQTRDGSVRKMADKSGAVAGNCS